mgnify:CR=1 FL=1
MADVMETAPDNSPVSMDLQMVFGLKMETDWAEPGSEKPVLEAPGRAGRNPGGTGE